MHSAVGITIFYNIGGKQNGIKTTHTKITRTAGTKAYIMQTEESEPRTIFDDRLSRG